MPDGKHCPACGKDIGYWPVVRGLFTLRCPHCGAKLRHRLDDRMSAVTTAVAMGAVLASIVPGVLAGWVMFEAAGLVMAVLVGVVVWVGLSFGIGLVFQMVAVPALRRTQRLVIDGEREAPAEEESW